MIRRALLIASLGGAALLWLALGTHRPTVPSFGAVRAATRPSDARLMDRNGEVLQELRTDMTRRRLGWIRLAEISPALQAAVITSEDRRFYRHGGVDGTALATAPLRRITRGPRRGASTISMQVAARLRADLRHNGAPRSLGQKWRQMLLAWAIEARWSKAEILEAYLNLATFRGEVQGV
ncbi:MAG: transglycosylase domain-containing protein, partial [candidate division NC10 bacterium]|nr:transglycosylase domain-containing protein [candidate division NC10 bacterium]